MVSLVKFPNRINFARNLHPPELKSVSVFPDEEHVTDIRPLNKDLEMLSLDFEIWGMSKYTRINVEGSFSALPKLIY